MNDRTLTLTLTEQEINIVIAGLGKLPLEASLMVWQKVKQQAEAQIRASEEQSKQTSL